MRLVLLFIGIPLLDIYLLLKLAKVMGSIETIFLVIATGVFGASMSRMQGARVMADWQAALGQGKMPEEGVLGGVLWLLGSALLITPGVVTDLAGLLMLLPFSRRWLVRWVRPMVQRRMQQASFFSGSATSSKDGAWDFVGDPFSPGSPRGAEAEAEAWVAQSEAFISEVEASGGVMRIVRFGSGGPGDASRQASPQGPATASLLGYDLDGKAIIDADFEVQPDDEEKPSD